MRSRTHACVLKCSAWSSRRPFRRRASISGWPRGSPSTRRTRCRPFATRRLNPLERHQSKNDGVSHSCLERPGLCTRRDSNPELDQLTCPGLEALAGQPSVLEGGIGVVKCREPGSDRACGVHCQTTGEHEVAGVGRGQSTDRRDARRGRVVPLSIPSSARMPHRTPRIRTLETLPRWQVNVTVVTR